MPTPYIAGGPVGAFIHVGEVNRRGRKALSVERPRWCYALWTLESGSMSLQVAGDQQRLSAPAAVLLTPATEARLELPAAAGWSSLRFDVVHVPLRRGRRAHTWVHRQPARQPDPASIWGRPLPLRVADHALTDCLTTAAFCCANWWRDDLAWAAANARLAAWLHGYVLRLARSGQPEDQAEPDFVARCRLAMRTALPNHPTVASLAAQFDLGRQAFSERYRAEAGEPPGRALRRIRLEEARRLLATTMLDLAAITTRCGYRSVASFVHRFREETGLPPARWRRRQMGRGDGRD